MFDAIRSIEGCAEKLRSVLSVSDASAKVLRFVSDDAWGGSVSVLVYEHIADYLVQAWSVRNVSKHNGAVLPLAPVGPFSAPVGRGADGVAAMA